MRDLIIDTNVLILLVVGAYDAEIVSERRCKRTAAFSITDLATLRTFVARHRSLLTTSPVLAEVSNLMGNAHDAVAQAMVTTCRPMVEVVHSKEEIFGREGFGRLGYADASILSAASADNTVLTDDLQLYSQVLYEGHRATNFNHLRKYGP